MKAMLLGSGAAVIVAAACALNVVGSGCGGGDVLPACTYPSSLASMGSSGGQCTTARAVVLCETPSGGQVTCLGDDATPCPGSAGDSCLDECAPDEFGASCGHVGPGPEEAPGDGCTIRDVTPAGIALYCCPCGA